MISPSSRAATSIPDPVCTSCAHGRSESLAPARRCHRDFLSRKEDGVRHLDAQSILARNPGYDLTPAVWGAIDSLQVVQEALPMEDLYRVWDSGELKYQLSATYRVRVLGLESSEVRTTSPVTDAEIAIGRIADATT